LFVFFSIFRILFFFIFLFFFNLLFYVLFFYLRYTRCLCIIHVMFYDLFLMSASENIMFYDVFCDVQ
jgi:hypothetical protein